ncbi:MAG TPA: hypothetical protein VL094_12690 [Sphingomonadaceae bacterium]|nr:hypothetical protein [Sphingomonadaceae bacterium]
MASHLGGNGNDCVLDGASFSLLGRRSEQHARPCSDACTHSDTDARSDARAHSNSRADAYPDTHSNADAYPDTHSNADTYPYSDPNSHQLCEAAATY